MYNKIILNIIFDRKLFHISSNPEEKEGNFSPKSLLNVRFHPHLAFMWLVFVPKYFRLSIFKFHRGLK